MTTRRLTVIGDLVEDVVVQVRGAVRRGTDNPATIARRRGGSAANVAALAAATTPTRFIGRVGDDRLGGELVDALAATGVDVRVQRAGRTGAVVVLVDPDDGERTMFPDRAAAGELDPVPAEWLEGTDVLHLPAYGFAAEHSAAVLHDAIASARRFGARLSIDVSAVTLIDEIGPGRLRALLAELAVDVVLANAEEAALLGIGPGGQVIEGATVVVKAGPRPATVLRDGRVLATVPAVAVRDVVDTTGAGDAFAAAFVPQWASGAGADAACRAGHRLAAEVIGTPGAATPPGNRMTDR